MGLFSRTIKMIANLLPSSKKNEIGPGHATTWLSVARALQEHALRVCQLAQYGAGPEKYITGLALDEEVIEYFSSSQTLHCGQYCYIFLRGVDPVFQPCIVACTTSDGRNHSLVQCVWQDNYLLADPTVGIVYLCGIDELLSTSVGATNLEAFERDMIIGLAPVGPLRSYFGPSFFAAIASTQRIHTMDNYEPPRNRLWISEGGEFTPSDAKIPFDVDQRTYKLKSASGRLIGAATRVYRWRLSVRNPDYSHENSPEGTAMNIALKYNGEIVEQITIRVPSTGVLSQRLASIRKVDEVCYESCGDWLVGRVVRIAIY